MENTGHTDTPSRTTLWTWMLIGVVAFTTLCVPAVFIMALLRDDRNWQDNILARARAHFHSIVITRAWNAKHGGVYVVKGPGVDSNPYLKAPDIMDDRGRTLTLRNPALMTREISELCSRQELLSYHITSLRPLNPANAPDDFEINALLRFEKEGDAEAYTIAKRDGRSIFRYMGPLKASPSCMQCHVDRTYWEGDIRGGITVNFDVTQAILDAQTDSLMTTGLGVSALLMASLAALGLKATRRLKTAQATIHGKSITDASTGLYNRVHVMTLLHEEAERAHTSGTDASVIVIDADHYRQINDTLGHVAGDAILKELARLLTVQAREQDTVARFGDNEFLMLLPGLSLDSCLTTARQLRRAIERHTFNTPTGIPVHLTASLGVSSFKESGRTNGIDVDALLRDADRALAMAKDTGRNRACSILECR